MPQTRIFSSCYTVWTVCTSELLLAQPDPVFFAVKDCEELKRSLVTENDAPQMHSGHFLWTLAKSSHLVLLIHCKPGLHLELEQLLLQAGLQTLVDGQPGCWMLHPASWMLDLDSPSRILPFEI